MRTVLLLRHAKSDWNSPFDADHERSLNDRGRRAARVVGRFLAKTADKPDFVICSSARRARETLDLLSEAANWELEVRIEPRLYGAHRDEVFSILRETDDHVSRLLVVGHEPTSSETARSLCGLGMPSEVGPIRFPTSALARLDLAIERWGDVDAGCGQLVWLVPPKLFTQGDFEFVVEN